MATGDYSYFQTVGVGYGWQDVSLTVPGPTDTVTLTPAPGTILNYQGIPIVSDKYMPSNTFALVSNRIVRAIRDIGADLDNNLFTYSTVNTTGSPTAALTFEQIEKSAQEIQGMKMKTRRPPMLEPEQTEFVRAISFDD